MNVFVTAAFADTAFTHLPMIRDLAAKDRFGVHRLVDDPAKADIILFVDAHQHPDDLKLDAIRRHPVAAANPRKTFVYNELDQPWCAMQGLYVSMPLSSFDPRRQRSFPYLKLINEYVFAEEYRSITPKWLFSFMGRRVHPVREFIFNLKHERGLVEDTTAAFDALSLPGKEVDARKRHYARILGETKFVLCPRGAGPSSFRLFEAMAAGRVPVIISDEWVAPAGPAWDEFSLRIPECGLNELVATLESHEPRFADMAAKARRAWEEWLSPEVLFHRMAENCREILEEQAHAKAVWLRPPDRRYLYLWARAMKWKIKALAAGH